MAKGRRSSATNLELVKDVLKPLPDRDLEIVINVCKAMILDRRRANLISLYNRMKKAQATKPDHRYIMCLAAARLHDEFGINPNPGGNLTDFVMDLAEMYEDRKNDKLPMSNASECSIATHRLYDGLIEYIFRYTNYDEFNNGRFMRRS